MAPIANLKTTVTASSRTSSLLEYYVDCASSSSSSSVSLLNTSSPSSSQPSSTPSAPSSISSHLYLSAKLYKSRVIPIPTMYPSASLPTSAVLPPPPPSNTSSSTPLTSSLPHPLFPPTPPFSLPSSSPSISPSSYPSSSPSINILHSSSAEDPFSSHLSLALQYSQLISANLNNIQATCGEDENVLQAEALQDSVYTNILYLSMSTQCTHVQSSIYSSLGDGMCRDAMSGYFIIWICYLVAFFSIYLTCATVCLLFEYFEPRYWAVQKSSEIYTMEDFKYSEYMGPGGEKRIETETEVGSDMGGRRGGRVGTVSDGRGSRNQKWQTYRHGDDEYE